MDPALREVIIRYTIVGITIAGAAVWSIWYFSDVKHKNGAPGFVGADAGPAMPAPPIDKDTGDIPAPSANGAPPVEKAPSLASMFVQKDGVDRVGCAPACRLENYCGLRGVDACLHASCNGELRIDSNSDDEFARANDCGTAARAPCDEACMKRGTCIKDHSDDAACLERCRVLASHAPADAYQASRCVIESACDAVPHCARF